MFSGLNIERQNVQFS